MQCGQQVQRRVLEGRVTRLSGQRDRLLRPLDGEVDVVGKRLRHGDRSLDRVRSVRDRRGFGEQCGALLGRVRLRHDARRADDVQRHPGKIAGGTPGVAERQREVRRPAEQTQHVVAGEPRARRAGRVPQELDSLRRRRLQIGSLLEPASCLREAPAEPQLPGQLGSQCRGIRTVIVERGAADERRPGVVDDPVEARTPGVVGLGGGDLGEHRTAPRFVAALDLGELVRRLELLLTVLTDRLQGAVAGRRAAVDDEQAVVDEPGQPVGDGGTAAPGGRPRRTAASTSNHEANTATPRSSAWSAGSSRS